MNANAGALLRECVETLSRLNDRVQQALDVMSSRREKCERLDDALARLTTSRRNLREARGVRRRSVSTRRLAGRPGRGAGGRRVA